MLLLSEYSGFSDPGYIFQVFQSHKIVKSAETSVLQAFNKHYTTQDLCLLPSQYRVFKNFTRAYFLETFLLSGPLQVLTNLRAVDKLL
jgi:hypothetical protein